MNRKELINRIIERLYDKSDYADLKQILEEELPDFQRVDENRMKEIWESKYGMGSLACLRLIQEYNSTLPPALKPLPKEMPEWFLKATYTGMGIWNEIVKTYGTPEPKPNLPTVEELVKEIYQIWQSQGANLGTVAQKLHDKYSLHPREWWQDCDKFMYGGRIINSGGYKIMKNNKIFLCGERTGAYPLNKCSPYILPTIEQKFINSLTPEQMVMYKELNNENHNSRK